MSFISIIFLLFGFLWLRHENVLRLRNDLYCVGWGVKLYSLTHENVRDKVGHA